jgi:hypothetical protein
MERRERKRAPAPRKQPAEWTVIDTTEAGPARLYAPGRPHEVESGPARLGRLRYGRYQQPAVPTTGTPPPREAAPGLSTTEAGPARIARRPR